MPEPGATDARGRDRWIQAEIDAVVVSYNSRAHLRACVEPLAAMSGVNVVVVDNASTDGCLELVRDLDVAVVAREENGGFAVGCNAGWRVGRAPQVLFINPDAVIDEGSLRRLQAALAADAVAGGVAPRIEHADGSLARSLRRFPRVRTTLSQALFLHRLLRAAWADELVRDDEAYARAWSPDWVSGACLLVRRDALVEVGGWDESFFLFGEDVDLCRRLRAAGRRVQYEPRARVVHVEGASAPREATLPLLAAARIQYARKHFPRHLAIADRVAVALGALTHLLVSRGGAAARRGHARALAVAILGRGRLP